MYLGSGEAVGGRLLWGRELEGEEAVASGGSRGEAGYAGPGVG